MGTIIAVGGQKGGVGKTTTAIALVMEWIKRGRHVLLVDADPLRTALTCCEVAAEQKRPAPTAIAMGKAMWQPDQLPTLAKQYDVVVVDTPPRLGDVQRAALMVADLCIIPCGPSSHDVWALGEYLQLLSEARITRPKLHAVVLLTRKQSGTTIGKQARDVLTEQTGLPVLETELGYRVDYQEASGAGQGASTYRPDSTAACEVRELTDELERLAHWPKQRLRAVKR